jgi:hypothetical protein
VGAGLEAAAPSAAAAAAASKKVAAATVWLTRAATREKVATVAGCAAAVTSLSMPAPSAEQKWRRPQPDNPRASLWEAGEDRRCAIQSLTGKSLDAWICVVAVLAPTTAHTAATQWPNYCQEPMLPCSANKIFNNLIIHRKCHECFRKLICSKCYSSSSGYNLKYGFKYILEFCKIECKSSKNIPISQKNIPGVSGHMYTVMENVTV